MIDVDVAELLPHDGDMVFLDRVIEFDQHSMITELVVRDDGLFGNGQMVPSWLGIEYMAQTVAAHGGMMCRIAGKPVNFGFLLGTRRYHCNKTAFKVGERLTVEVEQIIQDQGMGVFECKILGSDIVATAKLSVYQPEDKSNMKIDKQ